MDNKSCCYVKNSCAFFAAIISIVIGIAVALLRFSAIITITVPVLWVFFGITAAYLFLLPLVSAFTRSSCFCNLIYAILTGVIGTILAALTLLTITFAATSVAGAIITGALGGLFTLTVTSTACLVKCLFCEG